MAQGGWWDRNMVPRIVRLGCGTPEVAELRRQVVPLATGDVFELGCGGGFNHPLYDPGAICSFSAVDPNPALLENARAAAQAKGWQADIRAGVGEALPFADASFDTVVCTYTLCSVDQPERVLAELRRVLRPDGRLLFLEHGAAPDPGVARWQRRIEPVWKHIAGNCHLTRPVGEAIRAGGFAVEPVGQGYFAKAPRWAGWMEWGVARPR